MQKASVKTMKRKLNNCKRLHNTKVLDKTYKNATTKFYNMHENR